MTRYVRLRIGLLRRAMQARANLLIENLVLRQQFAVYARQPKRLRLRDGDRLFWSVVARRWSLRRLRLQFVQPDTVVGGSTIVRPSTVTTEAAITEHRVDQRTVTVNGRKR